MNQRTTKKRTFNVIGITCRTSSVHAPEEIPLLWEKLMNENLLAKIPKRTSEGLYCIYTDYSSDHLGDYTVILGAESLDTDSSLPEGMVRHTIAESEYLCLPVKGDYPHSLIHTWEWVWKKDDLPRAYTSDFEYYPEGMKNSKEPKLDVYIALKK